MSKVPAILYSLAGRIQYADGVYTISAPSGFKFAQPLIEFQSTGMTDNATGNVLTLGDTSLDAAVPIKFPSYSTAGRPAAATAGAGATIYDTDLNLVLTSTGAAWLDQAGGDPDA